MKRSCLIFILALLSSCTHRSVPSDLQNRIQRELPLGSSQEQVASFLDANRVEHSSLIDLDAEPIYRTETSFRSRELDGKRDQIKRMFVVMRRNIRPQWFADVDEQIHLYFDDKGQLVAFTVREVRTGL
jgi:hypothetical protein